VTHIYRLQESGAVKEAEALMSLLGIKTSTKKRKKRLSIQIEVLLEVLLDTPRAS
jgi:hypothetical protein